MLRLEPASGEKPRVAMPWLAQRVTTKVKTQMMVLEIGLQVSCFPSTASLPPWERAEPLGHLVTQVPPSPPFACGAVMWLQVKPSGLLAHHSDCTGACKAGQGELSKAVHLAAAWHLNAFQQLTHVEGFGVPKSKDSGLPHHFSQPSAPQSVLRNHWEGRTSRLSLIHI